MIELEREAGILLHITSLPGRYGCGDLGPAAYAFLDFLQRTHQRVLQVLPLVPTAAGDSPYTSFSAFAGNPLLISPDALVDEGLVSNRLLPELGERPDGEVDFGSYRARHGRVLEAAYQEFLSAAGASDWVELDDFAARHQTWLDDYGLFVALVARYGHPQWNRWDPAVAARDPRTLDQLRRELARDIRREQFVQWQFFRQWDRLKNYAHRQGVQIFGDAPIFVAYESADVWAQQRLFHLDDHGNRTVVAGVPPDYFSATGQLWGNPLYRWDVMAEDGYQWWVNRLRHSLSLFDLIRLDHFRGFEAYWEVPAGAETAVDGRWVPGPGGQLFRVISEQLGPLPIVAEDLGLITPAVTELREAWGFPGMRVAQFGFDADDDDYHRPHRFPRDCVAYSGTHDNDTLVGWYRGQHGGPTAQRLLSYLHSDGSQIHWDVLRSVAESQANLVIFPLQDALGLGSEARMNIPGKSEGNWRWRFREEQLTDEVEARLAELTRQARRGLGGVPPTTPIVPAAVTVANS